MIYTLTLNPALDREMTVPEIALDRVLRAQVIRTDYGGKGFNVSRALLALGTESIALGFIGGAVGLELEEGLSSLGIHTDFVHVNGKTRINISVVAEDHCHYIKINEPGPAVTKVELGMLLSKVSSYVRAGDWWVLAGSPPPGLDPAFITQVIGRVQEAGAYAAIDMEGVYLHAGCSSNAFLVKPNAFEASGLTGRQILTIDDAIEALPNIHELGAHHVVISLGKTGAVYSDGSHTWQAEPAYVKERNPIGAGDAMLAGLVWALDMHFDAAQVLRWGVACGAAAASLDGTAMGSFELVESLAADVHVSKGGNNGLKQATNRLYNQHGDTKD